MIKKVIFPLIVISVVLVLIIIGVISELYFERINWELKLKHIISIIIIFLVAIVIIYLASKL